MALFLFALPLPGFMVCRTPRSMSHPVPATCHGSTIRRALPRQSAAISAGWTCQAPSAPSVCVPLRAPDFPRASGSVRWMLARVVACFALGVTLSACGGAPADEAPTETTPAVDSGASDTADVDASPPDPCASAKCTAHSTCTVVDGAATCPCDKGYLPWKSACSPDADEDGISEDEELEVASQLAPVLVFDTDEKLSDRRTHFAVTPTTGGGRTVYYAHGYYKDGGSTFGVTSHLGDSEFVVVTRAPGGDTQLFLSAHYQASTDASKWYPLSKFEKQTVDGVSRPVVFVALNKHGNYPDLATCEAGAYRTDTCSRGKSEVVPVLPDRNVGQSWKPLIDEESVDMPDTRREWFWTDVRFCGWQIVGGATADRSGCAPAENSYSRQMRAWESGTL